MSLFHTAFILNAILAVLQLEHYNEDDFPTYVFISNQFFIESLEVYTKKLLICFHDDVFLAVWNTIVSVEVNISINC